MVVKRNLEQTRDGTNQSQGHRTPGVCKVVASTCSCSDGSRKQPAAQKSTVQNLIPEGLKRNKLFCYEADV